MYGLISELYPPFWIRLIYDFSALSKSFKVVILRWIDIKIVSTIVVCTLSKINVKSH